LKGKKLKGSWKRRVAKLPHKGAPLVLRGSNYMPILRWNNSSLFAALNIILLEGISD